MFLSDASFLEPNTDGTSEGAVMTKLFYRRAGSNNVFTVWTEGMSYRAADKYRYISIKSPVRQSPRLHFVGVIAKLYNIIR